IYDFPKLRNGDKLPVCVVGGCHNSQFNVTILATMTDKDNSKHMWTYGFPAPECWSWWLTRKIGGGTIATIGNTGLGYGAVGEHGDLDGDNITEPDCLEALGGYWGIQFYKSFDEGKDVLGETWTGAINKYLDTFPGMDYQIDAKTVEQLPILGDPSLQIGGY
ncbi:MAG: C25 family cysteine peptidase, partial [Petrotogales bacterium]